MTSERISVSVNEGFFDAYLSFPKEEEGPGVLLIQEIFGVNDHIRAVADRLAEEGYVVLAPDLFWRMKPNIELGYEGEDRETALRYYERFDEELAMVDLKHAANALRNHRACTGRIAAMGFCLGGKLTIQTGSPDQFECGNFLLWWQGRESSERSRQDQMSADDALRRQRQVNT
ncbi:MAG: dienelactone hydrolase family protein [Cyanobacteriota/Melainabacteria group bacterium]